LTTHREFLGSSTVTNSDPPADLDPPADAEPAPAPPVSCEQLRQEAAERPKSLRLLPRITVDAVRLVWAANPRMLIASIALKLVNGAGLATALIFVTRFSTQLLPPRVASSRVRRPPQLALSRGTAAK